MVKIEAEPPTDAPGLICCLEKANSLAARVPAALGARARSLHGVGALVEVELLELLELLELREEGLGLGVAGAENGLHPLPDAGRPAGVSRIWR